MKKIGISTDYVCDLPQNYFEENDVSVMYFYITTNTGRFRDGFEIDSTNLIEYFESGGEKAETKAPDPSEYKALFEKQLEKYDEVIHISISDKISLSYQNALEAAKDMGSGSERIHVVNSEHLSTGIGHIVMGAVELRDDGNSVEDILGYVEGLKRRVSTSFIAQNADYLYRNGKVSKSVADICSAFMLHPVLTIKGGKIVLKGIQIGNYDKSVKRYIKRELRHDKKIDKSRLFITHAGCTVKMITEAKTEIKKYCTFKEVVTTKASATITSNCGKGTLGVLFIYNN